MTEISAEEAFKKEIDRKTTALTEYLNEVKVEISSVEAELAAQNAEKPVDSLDAIKCRDAHGEAVLNGIAKVRALEDWLVQVEEAFKQGNVSLDELVKELRSCKRTLYVERALLKRNTALIHASQTS